VSLTYSTYINEISKIIATDPSDQNFAAIIPGMIDYAEQRIYRELDLLNTTVRDSSATFTAYNRNFALPTSVGTFVTVQSVNAVTPSGTQPDSGTRNQLVPVSRDYLDAVWNSISGATVPQFFALLDGSNIIVGPWPDSAYVAEVVGTIRPTPLSQSNTSTFLTTNLPDLFVAASMVFVSGYMRNFGSQSDDPRMSASWEDQYTKLAASAEREELRKKFASPPGWTAYSTPEA
jgi:hypothetical protein